MFIVTLQSDLIIKDIAYKITITNNDTSTKQFTISGPNTQFTRDIFYINVGESVDIYATTSTLQETITVSDGVDEQYIDVNLYDSDTLEYGNGSYITIASIPSEPSPVNYYNITYELSHITPLNPPLPVTIEKNTTLNISFIPNADYLLPDTIKIYQNGNLITNYSWDQGVLDIPSVDDDLLIIITGQSLYNIALVNGKIAFRNGKALLISNL